MTVFKTLSALVLLALMASCANTEGPKMLPLFGEELTEMSYPEGSWTVKDGILSALEDQVLWAKGEYENFELSMEFMNEAGTNSGVIIYCTDQQNWIPNSVEVQIADDHSEKWGGARKDFQSGAIFGHLPATQQKVVNKPGEWNTMVIKASGQQIEVLLNGQVLTTMNMALWTSGTENPDGSDIPSWLPTPFAELPTKGTIGFQGKHGDAAIHYRNVKIRNL